MQQVAHAPGCACPSSHQALHARASTKPRMFQVMHTPGACNRSHTYWVVHACARTKRRIPVLTPGHACLCSHQAVDARARTRTCMPALAPSPTCSCSLQATHACVCTSPTPACALTPHPCVHSLAPYSHLPTFSCTHPAHLGIVNTWTYTLMRLIV